MGIYGSYHTVLSNRQRMAGRLQETYGDAISGVNLGSFILQEKHKPYRFGLCFSGGTRVACGLNEGCALYASVSEHTDDGFCMDCRHYRDCGSDFGRCMHKAGHRVVWKSTMRQRCKALALCTRC